MVLPDFLLIGAMKSGTTTLAADLMSSQGIVSLAVKEPNFLTRSQDDDEISAQYRRLYRNAGPGLRGDFSTEYAMRPEHEGVAEHARALLGPVPVFYLVRDPVDRAVSHYHHWRDRGMEHKRIDVALQTNSRYVDYSKYNWQVTPWVDAFGHDLVSVWRFEDYVDRRREVLGEIAQRLGVDAPSEGPTGAHNVHGRPIAAGWAGRVVGSRAYRTGQLGRIPAPVRQWLKQKVTTTPEPKEQPSAETIKILENRLHDDVEALGQLLGRSAPMWARFGDR